MPDPKKSTVREWIQLIFFVSATIFGFFTFWYRDIIVPSRLPAALVITPELAMVGRFGDTAVVRATFHVANKSQQRVYIPALSYTASGIHLQGKPVADDQYTTSAHDSFPESFERYSRAGFDTVIASGRLTPKVRTWFQPGGESHLGVVFFYVPLCQYELVRLKVDWFFARDVSELSRVAWTLSHDTLVPHFYIRTSERTPVHELNPLDPADQRWKANHAAASNWTVASIYLGGSEAGGTGTRECRHRRNRRRAS